jgi:hypothetical protein
VKITRRAWLGAAAAALSIPVVGLVPAAESKIWEKEVLPPTRYITKIPLLMKNLRFRWERRSLSIKRGEDTYTCLMMFGKVNDNPWREIIGWNDGIVTMGVRDDEIQEYYSDERMDMSHAEVLSVTKRVTVVRP